jgi:FG-GAP-like repeat
MKPLLPTFLMLSCGAAWCGATEFEAPVRLKAGAAPIRVESPGYAAPCWVDVDGDGKKDLVVGQFRDGKMKVYKNLGNGKFAEGVWLQAEGKIAEVPGVW